MFKDGVLDNELKYYAAAVYNMLDSLVCASLNIALDSVPVIFMSYTIAMVHELSKRLEKIGEDKIEEKQRKSQSRDRNMTELMKCVEIHLNLKGFSSQIVRRFSLMIFFQGMISSLIICTCIYIISLVTILCFNILII